MAAAHVGPAASGGHRRIRNREGRSTSIGALQRRLGSDASDRRVGADTARPVLPHHGGTRNFRGRERRLASCLAPLSLSRDSKFWSRENG